MQHVTYLPLVRLEDWLTYSPMKRTTPLERGQDLALSNFKSHQFDDVYR